MRTDQYQPLVGRTSWVLKRAERAAYAAVYDALRDLGLTPSQYGVLQALVRLGAASSAELARACFVTPQAMTGLVAGLERQGYISRKPLASSRVIEATVTPLGSDVYDEATKRVEDFDRRLTVLLDADEITRLRDLLERCVDSLEGGAQALPDAPDDDDDVVDEPVAAGSE